MPRISTPRFYLAAKNPRLRDKIWAWKALVGNHDGPQGALLYYTTHISANVVAYCVTGNIRKVSLIVTHSDALAYISTHINTNFTSHTCTYHTKQSHTTLVCGTQYCSPSHEALPERPEVPPPLPLAVFLHILCSPVPGAHGFHPVHPAYKKEQTAY